MANSSTTFRERPTSVGPWATVLAPYGLVGIGYSFETEECFGMFGGGAEWRLNDGLGIFGDIRYQINDDSDDGVGFRAGVRFVF